MVRPCQRDVSPPQAGPRRIRRMSRITRTATLTAAGALLAAALVPAAVAAAPVQERVEIDDSFVAEGICPFPVDVHATGRILVTTTYASDGSVARISERPNIR